MTEPRSPPRLAPSSGEFTTQNTDAPGPLGDGGGAWIGIGVLVVIVDCHRNFFFGVVTATVEEGWGKLY